MTEETEKEHRTKFWQAVAGISFGLWSFMVPISAKWVVDSLSAMTTAQATYAAEQSRRNELIETRMARYEERQAYIMQEMNRLQREHDRILDSETKNHR